jgi:hypothetical protein
MKTRFTIAVSMPAGAAIGGAAIQTLRAQAKPPGYIIAINQVSDLGHHCSHAPGRLILHLVSPSRRPRRVRGFRGLA